MSAYPTLFSPGKIGSMTLKNRLMMAPMVRNYGDERGLVTPRYVAAMERVARGGVGALIIEASYVSPEGRGFVRELGLHTDDAIPGFRQLVEAAHQHGTMIGPQIFHAGRQTSSAINGAKSVGPSAIPEPSTGETPHALTINEIHRIVDDFAQAARRAQEAGCDFVQIHGAHGYLITQFLSPFSNVRQDEYGGSLEARMHFLVQIIEAVRGAVGPTFPMQVRLSGEEQVPEGLTMEDTIEISRRLEMLRVDALNISAGNYASYSRGYMISPMAIPDGPLIPWAQHVKEAVRIPVIASGKIRTPEMAEEVIATGKADFVTQGRVLLADPDWPAKAQEGHADRINKCIACNQGCISRLFEQKDVWCTVNPEAGREQEFAKPLPTDKKRVLVIGGGPAGMEAAMIATGRGHQVTLCEELPHLGGQLIAAAAAPYRPGWDELRQHQMHELDLHGVDVRLNTKVEPEMVREMHVDAAIVAVGSSPMHVRIPGIESQNVVTARDVLEGKATVKGTVIIAGGGCSGAQTAEYLATKGLPVTIVEMLGDIAVDAPLAERELLLERLDKLGVRVQTETRIMRVEEGEVIVEHQGETGSLPADTVVICLGAQSNDGITEALKGFVPHVTVIGDALRPRKVTEAVVEGGLAALEV